MRIRRAGASMFHIITEKGTQLLLDPYISGNVTAIPDLKNPETLRKLDALLITHGHQDHSSGIADVVKVNPDVLVVCNNDFSSLLPAMGVKNINRLDISGSVDIKGVMVTMVSAAHGCSYGKDRTYAGLAGGFIIKLETGFKIYAAGDTGLSADLKLVIGDYYKPDLAIIPVGGSLGMDPEQAAYAAGEMIRAPRVIPCHYWPRPEVAPDPAAMAEYVQRSPLARSSAGNGEKLKAIMRERYPEIETIVLEVGQSYEIETARH